MIDIRGTRAGKIAEAKQGELFIPAGASECFLVGMVMSEAEAIIVKGENLFYSTKVMSWHRPGGLIIPEVRFEVDETGGEAVDNLSQVERGALLLGRDCVAIVGWERQYSYPVVLSGNPGSLERSIAFRRWRAVRGDGESKETFVEVGKRDALGSQARVKSTP